MIISVGSTNPVKIRATLEAAHRFDPKIKVVGKEVASGVSPMPMSRKEVRLGARTRALNALERADIGIGMEGGMDLIDDHYYLTSSVYATNGSEGAWGGEVLVRMPQKVAALVVDEGMELGAAMDLITGKHETKKKEGAVHFLTGGRLTRMQVFRDSAIMALAPLLLQD